MKLHRKKDLAAGGGEPKKELVTIGEHSPLTFNHHAEGVDVRGKAPERGHVAPKGEGSLSFWGCKKGSVTRAGKRPSRIDGGAITENRGEPEI